MDFLKRLFTFCAIFEMGWELFNFAGIYGAKPRRSRPAISPAPGAIQQQPEPPDGLDSAGRRKIKEAQAVHARQTYFDRIGANDKTNATK